MQINKVKFSGTVADGTFRSLGRNGRAGLSAELYLNTSKLCVKLPALATKSQCPTLIQNEPKGLRAAPGPSQQSVKSIFRVDSRLA